MIDTETSGAIPTDCPIEIALYNVCGDDRSFQVYHMKPEFPITPGASAVHGVLQAETGNRESHTQVLTRFVSETRERLEALDVFTLGWNVGFDTDIINSALGRISVKEIEFGNVIDLMPLAKRVFRVQETGGFSLDAVFLALNNNRESLDRLHRKRASHSAEADVEITYEVYRGLLDRAMAANGGLTRGRVIADESDFLDYAAEPVLLEEWPLGKHKGRPIEEVLRKDRQYVQWTVNQPWFRETRYRDLRHTLDSMAEKFGLRL